MLPTFHPVWLDHIWAKSAAPNEERGESLASHTWNVLSQFAALAKMRPDLPAQVGVPRLWYRLFWACFLHDLGKASSGFQAMLHGGDRWPRRHEVLSLAFLPWLDLGADDRMWIASAVASHHKEPDDVERYTRDKAALEEMVSSVPSTSLQGIWRWLDECREGWLANLEIPAVAVGVPTLITQGMALDRFSRRGAQDIQDALLDYLSWAAPFIPNRDPNAKIPPILLRGLTIQSDHTASAHTNTLQPLVLSAQSLLATWQGDAKDSFQLYTHQKSAMGQIGSALLVAPTGSGKTEAALLWAARQADSNGKLPRLFYTLPYQASMNAMRDRLARTFTEEKVGLQHGRSLLALYRQLMDKGYTSKDAIRAAKWAKNLARLNYHPVRVFSPYQMLKAFYRLKGYEPFLADFYGAAFIFDEIHAYEPKRLALILKSVEHLRKYFGAHFLFMTATFPSLIKTKLHGALGEDVPEISADQSLFTEFSRHRLHLLDGDMLDSNSLNDIVGVIASGRSVLVCCNTVERAQKAYDYFKTQPRIAEVEKVLLHGRYNARDRLAREKIVSEATGSRSDTRRPVVLVATQVVEVSLDIDLDTIYTDPAPLEALVQRFGRINRRRLIHGLAPVHIYKQPDDGQHIYDPAHVQGALEVLARIEGRPINEAEVSIWLDDIYKDDIARRWEEEYSNSAAEFDRACVQELRGFATAGDDLEEMFNELFDSVEVLPAILKDKYNMRLETDGAVAASELLVSISYSQYARLNRSGKVEARTKELPAIVNCTYDEQGLHLRK